MATSEPTSGVIVRTPIPRSIARIRQAFDDGAALDVPPHVTVLFPFLPPGSLDASIRRELADIAASHESFDVRFTTIGRFPGLLYLAPEPAAPFVALTQACVERFPDFPPYAGVHDEIVPHLTILEGSQAQDADVGHRLQASLPFSVHVRAIEVITPSEQGPWRLRWRLPLGPRRP